MSAHTQKAACIKNSGQSVSNTNATTEHKDAICTSTPLIFEHGTQRLVASFVKGTKTSTTSWKFYYTPIAMGSVYSQRRVLDDRHGRKFKLIVIRQVHFGRHNCDNM